ncbi:TIGR02996 domain-containing protein [Gemmata sp. JC673]|uniref:TIGR02996 domain-containing protein n=1 Tax=Gemmata algarum TaxID=2975278 RepID=A0ABU5F303_9BACT|nr:TIGR02996 domain-containing protein [Gemmata algarum]MDY3560249.1 TIGR02996 domain-containing protein [Gemmata algarum]
MSDEDALLSAIAAHPSEDTPRLAYADWLDEHDRPIRAEFIRLQCGWGQTAEVPGADQRKRSERVQFFIKNHRRDLIPGPLGRDLTVPDIAFDRGFLSKLQVTALQFVQQPGEFVRLCPPPQVSIRHLTATWFARFIVRPELVCVTSIAVNSPGVNAARALAACPHLERLEAGAASVIAVWERSPAPGRCASSFILRFLATRSATPGSSASYRPRSGGV